MAAPVPAPPALPRPCRPLRRVLPPAAAALLLAAGAAGAAGWTADDLGQMGDRTACLLRAEATFSEYFVRHGGEEIVTASWMVAGQGLGGLPIDALILCPIEGGVVVPFLVVHSTGFETARNAARAEAAARLAEIWQAQEP